MAFLASQTWYAGSSKWSAVSAWAATTAYAAGTVVRQLAAPTVGSERVFVCTIAGTSGGSEPTWGITQGAVTTDGTVTWVEVTGKAGVNGDTTNCNTWSSVENAALSVGVIIQDNSSASLQVVTTAGNTGSGSEPSFSTTAGVTTTDGSVTWTSLGAPSHFGPYAAPWARLNLALATGYFIANNDTVYVSNNHAETQSTTINYNVYPGQQFYINIICVADTAAPPVAAASTASVTTTSTGAINLGNNISITYIHGIKFVSNNSISVGGNNFRMHTCTLQLTAGSGFNISGGGQAGFDNGIATYDTNTIQLYNCSIIFSTSAQYIGITPVFTMIGGSITSTGSMPTSLLNTSNVFEGTIANVLMRGVNISSLTGTVLNANADAGGNVLLENCSLGAGATLFSGTPNNPFSVNYYSQTPLLRAHNCGNSSGSYPLTTQNILGALKSTTAAYRTGGASSFSTALGWSIITTANANVVNPFISEDISVINPFTSGSHTATIYLTSAATLTNANVWAEVEYPGTSGSTLSTIVNTKPALLSLAATLTTDSGSTWTGGLTNKYKIAVTISPQIVGVVKVRLYVAIPSTTIIVDPLPVLT